VKRPRGPARRVGRWITSRWGRAWVLWSWHKWRGISYPSWIEPAGRPWLSITGISEEEKRAVRRPEISADKVGGGSLDIPLGKMLQRCDRLADLLCSGAWDDGALKGQRTLMVFIDGGMVRCIVKVESPPLKMSAIGKNLDEALVALDALLGSSDPPWEQDTYRNGKPPRKK